VLGGGGEPQTAAILARLGHRPRRIVALALDAYRRGSSLLGARWASDGLEVSTIDCATGSDALDAHALEEIERSQVVLVDGGRTAELYEALVLTGAVRALTAASDRGALIVTHSASAHLLGAGSVDIYGDDGPIIEPTLAWLPFAVITHHRNQAEALANLRRWWWPLLDGLHVLLVPESGAVWLEPGWSRIEVIDDGPYGVGAAWWSDPATEPVRVLG
jgi:hypothetical protein